ncbi:alpha/beta fold hydrolase [Larsenimonas suaedae]|uniref:Alpha/beta hydrolase n=1 Tax=Larsenimonas suaedae TaxID=1851019 RepID=A0ABU1GYR6_9GAMM|nr:alpha/beta hydrolase [Larsenimonas suaedae]MCM2973021.1 alpha/beta hydrolase [Larsenimonas suaedae]MDR5896458.1 alpha/beta hydrolase [Larsenimonas suaedae]
MTIASDRGQGRPTLVLMHFFGSSHREWQHVIDRLDPSFRVVTLDMPGFGDARDDSGYDSHLMARHARDSIERLVLENVILVGHSFSGRIAMMLAAERPDWLNALVLVAPAPVGPQPVSEEEQRFQLGFDFSEAQARAFIDGAIGVELDAALYNAAVTDAMNAHPQAWRAWPSTTYAEDMRDEIGVLAVPTWVLVGDRDPSLPPETQRTLVMPMLENASLEVFEGYGHLLPMEMPERLAERLNVIARKA